MRSFSYLFLFIFLLGGLTLAQDAADLVDPSSVPIKLNQTTTPFEYDAAVLFDNGPIITLPGVVALVVMLVSLIIPMVAILFLVGDFNKTHLIGWQMTLQVPKNGP